MPSYSEFIMLQDFQDKNIKIIICEVSWNKLKIIKLKKSVIIAKKKVVDSVNCYKYKASYHQSCAERVKTENSSGKFACCDSSEKSEVKIQKQRKNSEYSEKMPDIDEKKLKAIIKETFQQNLGPVDIKMDKMNKKLTDLENSMQFMSNSFDEQKTSLDKALQELKELKKENIELRQRIGKMEARLDEIETKEKECNIIVAGIPKQTEPCLRKIVSKIITSMQVQIRDQSILECFRFGEKEEGPILVKLENVQLKKEVLKKIKTMKGTTIAKCGLEGQDNNIYINEDLPVNRRLLFKEVRDFKKKHGYRAAFCVNGTIFLKKSDQDAAIKIRSTEDLPPTK